MSTRGQLEPDRLFAALHHKKTFCIYDAPSPEAIRKAAKLNQLPADAITPVRVLDPYFYK
jgi:hypothetical protein